VLRQRSAKPAQPPFRTLGEATQLAPRQDRRSLFDQRQPNQLCRCSGPPRLKPAQFCRETNRRLLSSYDVTDEQRIINNNTCSTAESTLLLLPLRRRLFLLLLLQRLRQKLWMSG
jgi:hypothetical protein